MKMSFYWTTLLFSICFEQCHCDDDWVWDEVVDGGGAHGEPHFRMWSVNNDDAWFDYQGECDLVLVHNPELSSGQALNIHIRTTIQGIYSYIENAAIQIGEEVLEMQAGKVGKDKKTFLNGKLVTQALIFFAGYPIEKRNITKYCEKQKCQGADIIELELGIDGKVVITNWKGFLYVDVTAWAEGFIFSEGLMGRRNEPGKFARNGTLVYDVNDYAQEWQVLSTERQLFQESRVPQSPAPCIPPPKQILRKSTGVGFRRLNAANACSGLTGGVMNACIYDVMATGDVDMALPYLSYN